MCVVGGAGLWASYRRALAGAGKGSLQLLPQGPTSGAGSSLSPRVLEASAQSASQGHVQWVVITQSQQVGHRHLLWTHWAQ